MTGAGGPAGVAVIRALRAAGQRVLAIDADPSAVGLRLADVPAVVPRADAPGYGDALAGAVGQHRPVALICTVAEEYGALRRGWPRLADLGCRTWLPDPAAVDACVRQGRLRRRACTRPACRTRRPPRPPRRRRRARARGWSSRPVGRGSRDVQLRRRPPPTSPHAFAAVPGADRPDPAHRPGVHRGRPGRPGRHAARRACPAGGDETKAGHLDQGHAPSPSEAVDRAGRPPPWPPSGCTGPANVQGFVADPTATADRFVEINPRFSGGLPLTLAAGADVVGDVPDRHPRSAGRAAAALRPGRADEPVLRRDLHRATAHRSPIRCTSRRRCLRDEPASARAGALRHPPGDRQAGPGRPRAARPPGTTCHHGRHRPARRRRAEPATCSDDARACARTCGCGCRTTRPTGSARCSRGAAEAIAARTGRPGARARRHPHRARVRAGRARRRDPVRAPGGRAAQLQPAQRRGGQPPGGRGDRPAALRADRPGGRRSWPARASPPERVLRRRQPGHRRRCASVSPARLVAGRAPACW